MNERYERTALLLGEAAVETLRHARVALFGVGGVGGYAAEALARAGVGRIDLIDKDTVSIGNINRQLIALSSTVGIGKAQAMRERIADIDPEIIVNVHETFFLPENASQFDFSAYDYVIDAVDTVTAKLSIVEHAKQVGTPVISCMGTGNKLDPTAFRVADINKTAVCPLARVMRRELKRRGIASLKVVYSEEPPHIPQETPEEFGRHLPGSVSFVPGVAGLILAGEVIQDLTRASCKTQIDRL